MRRTQAARTIACSALTLALVGCSGGDPSSSPAPSSSPSGETSTTDTVVREDTVVEPAWTTKLDVIGQPEVEDGVALVLAKAPERAIQVVALDAATGERLWSRPWSPGGVPTGYGLEPVVARSQTDRAVTVLSVPPRDLSATSPEMWRLPLAVVDLRTGEEVARSEPVELLTPPSSCDDEVDVCFDTYSRDGGQRLDLDTGRVAPDPAGTPAGARGIGSAGLFATSDRPGEEVGVARDGRVLWSTPIARLMGESVTSDTGWTIEHDPASDRYIGWMRAAIPVDQRERAQAGRPFHYDAAILRLVAFNGADGTVLWRRDGAEHTCLGMETDTPTVRCVWTGTAFYDAKGVLTDLRGGSGVVEGFDPENGETTWSVKIAAEALQDVFDDRGQKVAGDDTVLVTTEDGPLVVDIATGATGPAEEDAVFTCTGDAVSFDYAMPFFLDGDPLHRRYGGRLYRPCGADGSERQSYTEAAVRDSGQDAGDGVHVLAGEGSLSGFDLSG